MMKQGTSVCAGRWRRSARRAAKGQADGIRSGKGRRSHPFFVPPEGQSDVKPGQRKGELTAEAGKATISQPEKRMQKALPAAALRLPAVESN